MCNSVNNMQEYFDLKTWEENMELSRSKRGALALWDSIDISIDIESTDRFTAETTNKYSISRIIKKYINKILGKIRRARGESITFKDIECVNFPKNFILRDLE